MHHMKFLAWRREGRVARAGRGRSLLLATLTLSVARAASAGATYTIAGFSDTPIATGLDSPTAFTWTPDGRMLILEKGGHRPNPGRGSAPGDSRARYFERGRFGRREGPAGNLPRPRVHEQRLRLSLLHDADPEESDLAVHDVRQHPLQGQRGRDPRQHRRHQRQSQRRQHRDRAGREALCRARRLGHGRRQVAGPVGRKPQRQSAADEPERNRRFRKSVPRRSPRRSSGSGRTVFGIPSGSPFARRTARSTSPTSERTRSKSSTS